MVGDSVLHPKGFGVASRLCVLTGFFAIQNASGSVMSGEWQRLFSNLLRPPRSIDIPEKAVIGPIP
jgi:hypothetical protein